MHANDWENEESPKTPEVEIPHCANCDYDLRFLTTNRCPECGIEFDLSSFISRQHISWKKFFGRIVVLPLLFAFLAELITKPITSYYEKSVTSWGLFLVAVTLNAISYFRREESLLLHKVRGRERTLAKILIIPMLVIFQGLSVFLTALIFGFVLCLTFGYRLPGL